MKAEMLTLVEPGRFEIETADVAAPGAGQIRVQLRVVGVCKSDIDAYRGIAAVPPRYVGGHEGTGTVVDVGAGVTGVAPGDDVALLGDHRFATFAIADERDAARLGRVGDYRDAVVEPLACCLNAVETAAVRPGDTAGVVGAGYMGQGVIRALTLTGAVTVIALDVKAEALRRAVLSGADRTVDLSAGDGTDALADVRRVPSSTAYVLPGQEQGPLDVVFECSGTPAGLELATSLLRVGGTLVMVGFQRAGVALPGEVWHMRGIRVLNASPMSAPDFRDTFRRTAALLSSGRLDGGGLVTHTAGLSAASEVFDAAGSAGYLKGAIEP